jgi:hypothetical protein
MSEMTKRVDAVGAETSSHIDGDAEITTYTFNEAQMQTFTEMTKEAAQESMIKDVHKKFPVPDREHAEMWPHDEQIRWAGIGEVISYLNSKV